MKKSKRAKKKRAVASKAADESSARALESNDAPAKANTVALRREASKKAKPPAAGAGLKDRVLGVRHTVTQFLREVRVELSKVTWPTRKETIASTSVVLVIVILIAAFLGIVDLGLSKIMRLVLS
jgi:preprotein translocase subunit SecE